MNLKVDSTLIKKYLEGACNEEERIQIREFLKQEDAQALFNEVWEEEWGDKIKAGYTTADAQQMQNWKSIIHLKIAEESQDRTIIPVPFLKKLVSWKYAAIWATLIIGAGLWAIHLKKNPEMAPLAYMEQYNPNGRRTIITLPDSSHVYLGAGSRLRYAERFPGQTREVSLEGEAFFEVTKNPKKPFIIHTGLISTRVLGTSFKIDAFLNKPFTVSVSTGKVRVDRKVLNKMESIAVLTPGQTVTWNEINHLKTLGTAVVSDIKGWKDGRLVFNQTPLSEIAGILERWYDVRISFENKKTAAKLMKVNLTANVSIDKLMKILGASGQFRFHIKDRHIIII